MDRTRTEKKFLISDWTTKILKISDQIGPIGSWIPGLNQSRYFNRSSTVFFDWLFLKSIDQGFTNKMVSNDGTAISNKQIGGLINGSIRCCSPWCTSFSCSDNLFATKIFALKISKNYQLATWTGTKLVPLQVFIDMLTLRLTESSETSRLWAFENKWSKIKSQIQYPEVCVINSHESWLMIDDACSCWSLPRLAPRENCMNILGLSCPPLLWLGLSQNLNEYFDMIPVITLTMVRFRRPLASYHLLLVKK